MLIHASARYRALGLPISHGIELGEDRSRHFTPPTYLPSRPSHREDARLRREKRQVPLLSFALRTILSAVRCYRPGAALTSTNREILDALFVRKFHLLSLITADLCCGAARYRQWFNSSFHVMLTVPVSFLLCIPYCLWIRNIAYTCRKIKEKLSVCAHGCKTTIRFLINWCNIKII